MKIGYIFFVIFIASLGIGLVFYKNLILLRQSISVKQSGRVIVLNGTSSSGKTPIARSLQSVLGKKYLYISLEHFLDMLSWDLCNLNSSTYNFLQSNEGIYASKRDDGSLDVKIGPLGKKILHEMWDVVEVFLNDGWNVILTVIEPLQEDVLAMKKKFKRYNPLFVYLYADKNIIIQREAARGDKLAGYALHLLEKYNSQDLHDLQIDIGKITQEQVTQIICEALC